MAADGGTIRYRERVHPGTSFFVALLLLVPAVVVVMIPVNAVLGWIIAPLLYALFAVTAWRSGPVVEIAHKTMRAGKASAPVAIVGGLTSFRGDDARAERGVRLDARAYLCVRGALPVVRVEIRDPADPTPYWLISTRHPEELTGAIAAERDARRSDIPADPADR